MALLYIGAQLNHRTHCLYLTNRVWARFRVKPEEINIILWLGSFRPIECTMVVAFTEECTIDLDVLHTCPARKDQRRVF